MTLANEVMQGLTKMLARSLDYSPKADELPFVAQVMIEDLQRRGLTDSDAERVAEAFNFLGPRIHKWPTPLAVIEALPKRNEYAQLPKPTGKPVDPKRVQADLAAARKKLGHPKSVMKPGEGYGDYRRAMEQSGLSKAEFDRLRLEGAI